MSYKSELIEQINELRKKKNAVILAHNYQIADIQDMADFVGDSLGLSRQAAETNADIIVFCGVHFMAETASIISPDKRVLLPDLDAGCSLAASISADQLRGWKSENPGAVVVSYINTTAEVKAESDYCCTSSNAVEIINSIPEDREVLFLPDRFLGSYVQEVTGREIKLWNGACHVHEKIGEIDFDSFRKNYPNAEFLVHPECGCSSSCMLKSVKECDSNIHIFSTQGMINFVKDSPAEEFVIATEVGILHQLKRVQPEKRFIPASENSVCEYMKLITLEKLRDSILFDQFEVKVDSDLAQRAKLPIERMLTVK